MNKEENAEKLEKMLDRVRKLLALAGNNPSEEEAISASLKAQELIAKYDLDLTELDKVELEIGTSEFYTGIDKSWKYGLSSVVANNFRCCCYWVGKRTVVFYGYLQDTQVAKLTFEYLFKVGEKGARKARRESYKKYGTETGIYFSYTRGFIQGVKSALEAQCTALMIVTPPEVKEQYEEYKIEKNMKTQGNYRDGSENGTSMRAYNRGFSDGRTAGGSRNIESKK